MNTMLIALIAALPLAVVAVTIVLAVRGGSKRKTVAVNLAAFALVGVLCCAGAGAAFAEGTEPAAEAATAAAEAAEEAAPADSHNSSMGLGLLAAALVTGLAGIGGGIAVAAGAPAAIAANSENPKTFGKSLIFVALGESIALYGLVISIMILNKLV